MWKLYRTMKCTLGYAILQGINVAITVVTLLRLFKSTGDEQKDEFYSGIALLAYGVGCFFGAYTGGKLCDLMIVRRVTYLGHLVFAVACIFSIMISLIDVFPLSCLACFCWGFSLFFIVSNGMVICSKLFNGTYQAFAVVRQMESFALILYYSVSLASQNSAPIPLIMLFLLFLVIPSFWLTSQLPEESTNADQIISFLETDEKIN